MKNCFVLGLNDKILSTSKKNKITNLFRKLIYTHNIQSLVFINEPDPMTLSYINKLKTKDMNFHLKCVVGKNEAYNINDSYDQLELIKTSGVSTLYNNLDKCFHCISITDICLFFEQESSTAHSYDTSIFDFNNPEYISHCVKYAINKNKPIILINFL